MDELDAGGEREVARRRDSRTAARRPASASAAAACRRRRRCGRPAAGSARPGSACAATMSALTRLEIVARPAPTARRATACGGFAALVRSQAVTMLCHRSPRSLPGLTPRYARSEHSIAVEVGQARPPRRRRTRQHGAAAAWAVRELVRSNDLVASVLGAGDARRAGHRRACFDAHISRVEGSIGAIPRRLMVRRRRLPRRRAACSRECGRGAAR